MPADRSACDIDELIAALAHKMNLKAIAEGIESARQVERLLALECEYGQGCYFSQPLDAKAPEQSMVQQAAQARTSEVGTANRKDEDQLQNQKRRTYVSDPHRN